MWTYYILLLSCINPLTVCTCRTPWDDKSMVILIKGKLAKMIFWLKLTILETPVSKLGLGGMFCYKTKQKNNQKICETELCDSSHICCVFRYHFHLVTVPEFMRKLNSKHLQNPICISKYGSMSKVRGAVYTSCRVAVTIL